jgi:hypothetical protein
MIVVAGCSDQNDGQRSQVSAQDAAVACTFSDGGCPAGCARVQGSWADVETAEPCVGKLETLGCLSSGTDATAVEACVKSRDGRKLGFQPGELIEQLLDSGEYVECDRQDAQRLKELPRCED